MQLAACILNLFVPLIFIFLSSSFLIISLYRIFVSFNFNLLLSRRRFRDFWFANFWQWFGSFTSDLDKSTAAPLVARAYGRVLDLGPGSGLTVPWIDPSKIEMVYAVEPNTQFHPALRAAADRAGLGERYKILGCGAEDLASRGIERESIDTVICCKVLCGVPVPERVIKDLYSYVVPGGQFLVHEHVRNRDNWAVARYQDLVQVIWPKFMAGCNINRPTDEILRRAGTWDKVELGPPQGQKTYESIPFSTGRLVKAKN